MCREKKRHFQMRMIELLRDDTRNFCQHVKKHKKGIRRYLGKLPLKHLLKSILPLDSQILTRGYQIDPRHLFIVFEAGI